ncbi:MAG: DNA polymerase IV [Lewinellaceae bacterium]|nr:DNA polymerase IV [Lewinellaceae bacterium]
MFDRAILHLDLDAFFVSVECLHNDALRGKPLIIGGQAGRGVVTCCSYEARRFGVHAAMPVRMALRLCPDAIVLRGDMERYTEQSRLITEIVEAEAPLFEKASIDEFYLDLSGMDRYVGCWKWSKELREKIIRESGLPISMGLSVNKLISKIGAGEAKPNGSQLVETGMEKAYIAPLSTAKIPSIGKETYRKLSFMGIRKVETLAQVPPQLLERQFGKHGRSMWKKANAIDDSPVIPYHDRQSLSAERTFQTDTIDMQELHGQLTDLCMKLSFELRQAQKLTSCVTVKIRYTDFNTYTRQSRIPYTASDQVLLRHVRELFDKLYERRQLVRLIGIRFSGLVHGHTQLSLFDASEEEVALDQALDQIRKRFGSGAVRRGSGAGDLRNGVF